LDTHALWQRLNDRFAELQADITRLEAKVTEARHRRPIGRLGLEVLICGFLKYAQFKEALVERTRELQADVQVQAAGSSLTKSEAELLSDDEQLRREIKALEDTQTREEL
jgi:hypothetical protein